jgi:hypothetical protein
LTLDLPQRRVVVLGASNVAISFSTIVSIARQSWGEPVEIMAAMGHGRSYGQDSAVLGRKISGIFPCALWQDLQKRPPMPTAALITDIGNDLLYGATPKQLLEWVERCLDRLAEIGAATIVTQLPTESLARLGERRFQFFRRLLFRRSKLTLAEARAHVREINERLVEIGRVRKVSVIPVSGAWYGFDPIHIKRRIARRAWGELLAPWRDTSEPLCVSRSSLQTILYLASRAPHERSIWGLRRCAKQPSGRFADGTTISLY